MASRPTLRQPLIAGAAWRVREIRR